MTDQTPDITHLVHNPFDAPKQKTSPVAWIVALGFVLLIHAVIGYYLYTMRFTIKDGHIHIPVMLDGRAFDAVIDTGSQYSIISLPVAGMAFGLRADSPGVTPLGAVNSDPSLNAFMHTFASLSFGGVTVLTPDMMLLPDRMARAGGRGQQTEAGDEQGEKDHNRGDDIVIQQPLVIAQGIDRIGAVQAAQLHPDRLEQDQKAKDLDRTGRRGGTAPDQADDDQDDEGE